MQNKERIALIVWYISLMLLIFINIEVAAIAGLITSVGVCLYVGILIRMKGKSSGKEIGS